MVCFQLSMDGCDHFRCSFFIFFYLSIFFTCQVNGIRFCNFVCNCYLKNNNKIAYCSKGPSLLNASDGPQLVAVFSQLLSNALQVRRKYDLKEQQIQHSGDGKVMRMG